VWRQDHNGFTHQDPGFLDVVLNKDPNVCRLYLPPDVNTLLCVADPCLRSTGYVNVIVADKQKHLQYMSMDEAIAHCTKGLSIWNRASNDEGSEPDVVMACAGDIPTKEALAAVTLLREHFHELRIRFINVVDLYKLVPSTEHPHGLSDRDFDSLFTTDKPIIFNFHGYPWLIHRLTYRRNEPPEPPRPWLQGEGQHQHAPRSGHPEPDRPLQPGHRRHRPGAVAAARRRAREGAAAQPADRVSDVRLRARHRQTRDRPVDVAALSRAKDR
jgi:hypothetical protein